MRAGEDPEAIPVRELRHEAQQGALCDRHVVFVAGHRQEPRRRALEHHEVGRDLGDARNELRGAGAGADHGDALAVQVDGVVPPGRVERRPREVVDALDVGHRRPVELSGRAHERIEPVRLRLAAVRRRVDEPGALGLVPSRAEHFGGGANAVTDTEALDTRAEVVEQHRLRRVVLRPVGRLRGRVAVEVVLDVDAATRVVVLEPRAPDVVVLLEHDDLDAGLAEPVRGDDARHAGADDAHGDARARADLADRPGRPPQVGAVEGELGLVERLGVVVDRRTAHELDEPAAIGRSQRRLLRAARVAVADQRGGGELARLGDLLRRVAGIGLEHPREVRPQVVADDREVAGQVGDRREQRRDLGVREARADFVIRRGDRLGFDIEAHGCSLPPGCSSPPGASVRTWMWPGTGTP